MAESSGQNSETQQQSQIETTTQHNHDEQQQCQEEFEASQINLFHSGQGASQKYLLQANKATLFSGGGETGGDRISYHQESFENEQDLNVEELQLQLYRFLCLNHQNFSKVQELQEKLDKQTLENYSILAKLKEESQKSLQELQTKLVEKDNKIKELDIIISDQNAKYLEQENLNKENLKMKDKKISSLKCEKIFADNTWKSLQRTCDDLMQEQTGEIVKELIKKHPNLNLQQVTLMKQKSLETKISSGQIETLQKMLKEKSDQVVDLMTQKSEQQNLLKKLLEAPKDQQENILMSLKQQISEEDKNSLQSKSEEAAKLTSDLQIKQVQWSEPDKINKDPLEKQKNDRKYF